MTTHRIFDWTPQAVVFDCDGTLVDSERHWQQARDIVLREHGVAPDPEFTETSKGLHYAECGALMARLAGRPDAGEEMTRQLLANFRALVAQRPVPVPGAQALVKSLSRFAPLAVASNCPADVVEFCIESVGLRRHFRHIVVPGEDVLPKPRPDAYVEAARRLGVDRADTLAVEDSANGLKAAVDAGLRVIGVGRNPSKEALALADLWVDTLDDPGLVAWAESRPGVHREGAGNPHTASPGPPVPRQGGPARSGTEAVS
ncbi:HAD family hydrolase [Streptomyces colonosanans]|uniref:Hydrolase n=1 Tax=Streptomyces colonosanans TaxID=1428652 RepID=A0A1S2PLY1_9ACTN|nr:HAD family phosphatase [Streptomyces colonosanans]OIJ94622.1 hydrolase [Streptomyces colonosanans]